MEKASMYIFGMSCAGCVASVKMALEDVPGVKHAAVDLEQLWRLQNMTGNDGAIEMAVKEAGFTVEK